MRASGAKVGECVSWLADQGCRVSQPSVSKYLAKADAEGVAAEVMPPSEGQVALSRQQTRLSAARVAGAPDFIAECFSAQAECRAILADEKQPASLRAKAAEVMRDLIVEGFEMSAEYVETTDSAQTG